MIVFVTSSRSVIMFVLETAVELMMVQGLRCLKDPSLPIRDRQLLKRELGTELVGLASCLDYIPLDYFIK